MSKPEKMVAISKLFKKLQRNQAAFLVDRIDQVQQEIERENLSLNIKSKKGVLHEISLRRANVETRVKIFEKKVNLDEERKFFLQIGLRRLNYSFFKPRVTQTEQELLQQTLEKRF